MSSTIPPLARQVVVVHLNLNGVTTWSIRNIIHSFFATIMMTRANSARIQSICAAAVMRAHIAGYAHTPSLSRPFQTTVMQESDINHTISSKQASISSIIVELQTRRLSFICHRPLCWFLITDVRRACRNPVRGSTVHSRHAWCCLLYTFEKNKSLVYIP